MLLRATGRVRSEKRLGGPAGNDRNRERAEIARRLRCMSGPVNDWTQ